MTFLFTIQNVPIKSYNFSVSQQVLTKFTIQNVPIKLLGQTKPRMISYNLQYKMFLLNYIFIEKERL